MRDFDDQHIIGRDPAPPGRGTSEGTPACAEPCQVKHDLEHYQRLATKARFVAGIGHALNNPLQVILGTTDLLLADGPASPVWRQRVEAVQDAAERAAATARSLMMFARERRLHPEAVRAEALFEAVLARLAAPLAAAGVDVRRQLDPHVTIVIDAALMDEVLTHLVVNAEEAMRGRPGGVLTVSAGRVAERARLAVEDTGPGIPAAMRQRIFEPLHTSKMPQHGAGLGLAICHGIVVEHGGTLTLEEAASGGARFVVDLPAAPPGVPFASRSV